MNERPWLLVLGVAFLVALRPSAAPRVDLHVDLKERVNAVYHVACLAGTISCTTDAFERFFARGVCALAHRAHGDAKAFAAAKAATLALHGVLAPDQKPWCEPMLRQLA
jgi:hypothetical protein